MAVAFNTSDARRPTAGTTISFSYTSSAGSDRLLLSATNGEGVTVNSGTYAGASLTNSGSTGGYIIWSKAGNASGANTLSFSLSGYGTARVVTSDWTGADQTTPVGTMVSNAATSASITTGSITCPSNGGVWGMANTGYQGASPTLVAGTGTTLASTATRNGTAYGGGYRLDTGALNWTQGASTAYTAIGIPINAVAAGGGITGPLLSAGNGTGHLIKQGPLVGGRLAL